MSYTVKNVKTFRGKERDGFNTDLYRDDKKVAFVINDGSGGRFAYRFVNEKERAIFRFNFKMKEYKPCIWETVNVDEDIIVISLVHHYLRDYWEAERAKKISVKDEHKVVPEKAKRLSNVKERLKKEMGQSLENDRELEESLFGTW